MKFPLSARLTLAGAGLSLALLAASQLTPGIHADPVLGPQYPVDHAPLGIDVDEQENRVYVANFLGNNDQGSFSVVDIDTGDAQHVPFPIPQDAVHNDATGKMYISGGGDSGRVGVVHRANPTVVAKTIDVGRTPKWMSVDETRNRIYVPLHDGQAVVVIDGNTDEVIARIDLTDRYPVATAVDVAANRIYVTAFSSEGRIAVIDGNTNTKVGDLMLRHDKTDSMEAVVDQTTGRLFVTHNDEVGWVSAFDRSGNRIDELQLSTRVTGITFNPITSRVFVSNEYSNPINERSRSVSVLDTDLNELEILTMPDGGIPGPAMGVDESRSRVYVGNTYSKATGPRTMVMIQDDGAQAPPTTPTAGPATPTYTPTPVGTPARLVYVPFVARGHQAGSGW